MPILPLKLAASCEPPVGENGRATAVTAITLDMWLFLVMRYFLSGCWPGMYRAQLPFVRLYIHFSSMWTRSYMSPNSFVLLRSSSTQSVRFSACLAVMMGSTHVRQRYAPHISSQTATVAAHTRVPSLIMRSRSCRTVALPLLCSLAVFRSASSFAPYLRVVAFRSMRDLR